MYLHRPPSGRPLAKDLITGNKIMNDGVRTNLLDRKRGRRISTPTMKLTGRPAAHDPRRDNPQCNPAPLDQWQNPQPRVAL